MHYCCWQFETTPLFIMNISETTASPCKYLSVSTHPRAFNTSYITVCFQQLRNLILPKEGSLSFPVRTWNMPPLYSKPWADSYMNKNSLKLCYVEHSIYPHTPAWEKMHLRSFWGWPLSCHRVRYECFPGPRLFTAVIPHFCKIQFHQSRFWAQI